MTITKLVPRAVAKPWGKAELPAAFASMVVDEPVGEIWFEHPDNQTPALLVKYLFTSEKLSVQVHPDDALAVKHGYAHGKEEAWVITEASSDAHLGLGLKHKVDAEELRSAALDGSIEGLMDWKLVKAGEHYHVVPGTIHAIGGGLTIVEVQQYADLTYRLYDYGRPRELHLDNAVEAATAGPYKVENDAYTQQDSSELLVAGPKFRLVRHFWKGALDSLPQRITSPWWFIPLTGEGVIDERAWQAGDCFLIDEPAPLQAHGEATALFACAV